MATVNFSVPDEAKRMFDATFAGKNKSAVIARLMMQAVEDEQRKARRARAIDELLALRERAPRKSDAEIRAAREKDRP
ncbi:MAG: hypothetical protein ACYDA8_01055 [Deferrisomatales bacterium]